MRPAALIAVATLLLAGCTGNGTPVGGGPPGDPDTQLAPGTGAAGTSGTGAQPGAGDPAGGTSGGEPGLDADGDGQTSARELPVSAFRNRDHLGRLVPAPPSHACDPTGSAKMNAWATLPETLQAETRVLAERLAGLLGAGNVTAAETRVPNATGWRTPSGSITVQAPWPRGPGLSFNGVADIQASASDMLRLLQGIGFAQPGDDLGLGPDTPGVTDLVVRGQLAGAQILGEQSEIHVLPGGSVRITIGHAWRDASAGSLMDEGLALGIARHYHRCVLRLEGMPDGGMGPIESASDVSGFAPAMPASGEVAASIVYAVRVTDAPSPGCPAGVTHIVVVDAVTGHVHGYRDRGCLPDHSRHPWHPGA